MNILHINTNLEGGASLCVLRIHKALLSQSINSAILVRDGNSEESIFIAEPDIIKKENIFVRSIKRLLRKTPWFFDKEKMDSEFYKKNYSLKDPLYIHHPFSAYTNIAHHPLVEWADVIHLHWVPEFIDYPTFFKEVKKPIVWTLHDMHPSIGVMHYESQFTTLPDHLSKIDTVCRKIKQQGLSHATSLNVVAISRMMKDVIEQSYLTRRFPVTLIHNGIDVEAFCSHVLSKSSVISGISSDTILFLFSSLGIFDRRKGLDRILAALEFVKQETARDIALIAVGSLCGKDAPSASFPIYCTGTITDNEELSKYYSIADFFILASYEESFAQTVVESLACGTPVISTPVGISLEIINSFNGVICNGYDPESLKEGIEKAMSRSYDSQVIRNNVVEYYNYDKIAKEYISLYKKVVGK